MAEDKISKMLEGVQCALEKVKEEARSTYFQSSEKEKEGFTNNNLFITAPYLIATVCYRSEGKTKLLSNSHLKQTFFKNIP